MFGDLRTDVAKPTALLLHKWNCQAKILPSGHCKFRSSACKSTITEPNFCICICKSIYLPVWVISRRSFWAACLTCLFISCYSGCVGYTRLHAAASTCWLAESLLGRRIMNNQSWILLFSCENRWACEKLWLPSFLTISPFLNDILYWEKAGECLIHPNIYWCTSFSFPILPKLPSHLFEIQILPLGVESLSKRGQ